VRVVDGGRIEERVVGSPVEKDGRTAGRPHHQIVDPIKQSPAGTIELSFAPHFAWRLATGIPSHHGRLVWFGLKVGYRHMYVSSFVCPWEMMAAWGCWECEGISPDAIGRL
jgi:hypothetical protein